MKDHYFDEIAYVFIEQQICLKKIGMFMDVFVFHRKYVFHWKIDLFSGNKTYWKVKTRIAKHLNYNHRHGMM